MKFELTVLGSNSAFPTSERYPTAHVLNVHERFFLIDCGEGTQMQLRRNHIGFAKINSLFISHLHGDHYFGIFGLISTFRLLGRKTDLHIYAPKELEKIVYLVLGYNHDTMEFKLVFHQLNTKSNEVVYEDKILTVTSFPLKHRIPTCGFLFKEKLRPRTIKRVAIDFHKIPIKDIKGIKDGNDFLNSEGKTISNNLLTLPPPSPRSYAFCSDTAYSEEIIPVIKDVDLLYHESTYLHELSSMAETAYHSTSHQAATIALKANVKRLVIGHFSSRYKDVTPLLEEARKVFPETYEAIDNKVYSVELRK